MKKYLLLIVLSLIIIVSYSQQKISGKSTPQKFNYKPTYKRGVPPNLFVDMSLVMIMAMVY